MLLKEVPAYKRLHRLCLLSLFLLSALQGIPCGSCAADKSAADGMRDINARLYREAVSRIDEYAVFADPGTTGKEIAREGIGSYLHRMDPHSEYLTLQEFARFREVKANNYVGVGLEIEKAADGNILCFPLPSGPAERAGIRNGEILDKIEGISTRGKSLYTIAAMTQGRPGTRVKLAIRLGNGGVRDFIVTRSKIICDCVSVQREGGFQLIRIAAFTQESKYELEKSLKKTSKTRPLVIDVRGNRGGDLLAAMDSAGLFLKKGMIISTVRMRTKNIRQRADSDGAYSDSPIYLWQDGKTASSAEVFIAALTGNGRAVSIGIRTYGKGTRQDVIELSDGSALVLTTGYLETPGGAGFNKKGLEPGYPLGGKTPDTADYWTQTKKLIN